MNLSDFEEEINYLIENEELKFSCFKTTLEEKNLIKEVGLDLNEKYDGEYYSNLDLTLANELKNDEVLIIINDFTDREKLHYDNYSIFTKKPFFCPINIVGFINGNDLTFEPNNESIIKIEKPLEFTLKK